MGNEISTSSINFFEVSCCTINILFILFRILGGSSSLLSRLGLSSDVETYSILRPLNSSKLNISDKCSRSSTLANLQVKYSGTQKTENACPTRRPKSQGSDVPFISHSGEEEDGNQVPIEDAPTDVIARDQSNFTILQQALKVNGFSDEDIIGVFEVLAAILHLGNIVKVGSTEDVNISDSKDPDNNIELDECNLNSELYNQYL